MAPGPIYTRIFQKEEPGEPFEMRTGLLMMSSTERLLQALVSSGRVDYRTHSRIPQRGVS